MYRYGRTSFLWLCDPIRPQIRVFCSSAEPHTSYSRDIHCSNKSWVLKLPWQLVWSSQSDLETFPCDIIGKHTLDQSTSCMSTDLQNKAVEGHFPPSKSSKPEEHTLQELCKVSLSTEASEGSALWLTQHSPFLISKLLTFSIIEHTWWNTTHFSREIEGRGHPRQENMNKSGGWG